MARVAAAGIAPAAHRRLLRRLLVWTRLIWRRLVLIGSSCRCGGAVAARYGLEGGGEGIVERGGGLTERARKALSSTTHRSVNWYSVWRYSRIGGLTAPIRRNVVRPAAKMRGRWPARR